MAADDEHEALRQIHSYARSMMRMLHGKSYLVPTPNEAASYPFTASEQQVLDRWTNSILHGTPDQVAAHLKRPHEKARPDEITIASVGHTPQASALHSTHRRRLRPADLTGSRVRFLTRPRQAPA